MGAPTRTCVVCRKEAPKGELVRVVRAAEGLVVDIGSQLPGRGAYVHRSTGCGAVKGVFERLYYSISKGSSKRDTWADRADGDVKLTAELRKRFESELLECLVGKVDERVPKPKRFRMGKISPSGL